MVWDLLSDFVSEAWFAELYFSSLEKVSGRYVANHCRNRHQLGFYHHGPGPGLHGRQVHGCGIVIELDTGNDARAEKNPAGTNVAEPVDLHSGYDTLN